MYVMSLLNPIPADAQLTMTGVVLYHDDFHPGHLTTRKPRDGAKPMGTATVALRSRAERMKDFEEEIAAIAREEER